MTRGSKVGFAAWAALTLGIALNTMMFSAIEGFLLRPLPVTDIDSVVRVRELARGDGAEQLYSLSPASFVAWREQNRVFDGMAAATSEAVTLTGEGDPMRVQGARVSANFFDVLGLRAAAGRTFVVGEDRAGENRVAVLGHDLWQARFGADADIVGADVTLDGIVHTVVGVMPRGISHPYDAGIWIPFDMDALVREPSGNFLYVPARIRPDLTLAAAGEALDGMITRLVGEGLQERGTNASHLTPLRDELLGSLRPVLAILFTGSLMVLLLAVFNVCNLLLARCVSERHETALRVALGARSRHLFLRALRRTGAVVLGAWLASLILCLWTLEPMLGLAGGASINEFDAMPRVNWAIVAYTLSVLIAVVVLLAAVESRAAQLRGAVEVGREKATSLPMRTRRVLGILVAGQFALSFALAGATLMVAAGYDQLIAGDLGYTPDGLHVTGISLPVERYPDTVARTAFVESALAELRARPGVIAAGASTVTPDYGGTWGAAFTVPGHEPPPTPGYELTHHRIVSEGYLGTLGAPLIAGRDFDGANLGRDRNSVIVSRRFAERFWDGPAAAVGRTVNRVTADGPVELTIVGVVGDVAEAEQASAFDVPWAWYLPLTAGSSYDFRDITLVLRTEGSPTATLREAVGTIDPQLALFRSAPMVERLAETFGRERWSRYMFAAFGVSACLIAVIGLYSALRFVTALRWRELGVRMALGAPIRSIAAGIVRQALFIGCVGIALGIPLLWAGQRILKSTLPALGAGDGAIGAVGWLVVALVTVAALAALPPAMAAARIAPMTALREE